MMMRIQPVLAQPPAAPPAPPAPAIAGSAPQADVMPSQGFTQAYVRALEAKRSELSRQLSSAQGRRDEVASALEDAPPGTARTGLEQRISVLDGRLAQLETDIAANGRQLAAAPGNLLTSSSTGSSRRDDGGPNPRQITAISIVFTLFVMAPLAFAAARRILRRPFHSTPTPQFLESTARLERMEQAVDAIAVEVERISEGQRFVTGLLAKRGETPAIQGQGATDPLRVGEPLQASGRDAR